MAIGGHMKRWDALGRRIARQNVKLGKIHDRLGYLMTQRANEEDKLAAMIEELRRLEGIGNVKEGT